MADNEERRDHSNADIQTKHLQPLSWSGDDITESLETIYDHVVRNATSYVDWYIVAKRPKQLWARRLRVLAIVLVTIAGILPVLSQIAAQSWSFSIAPAWATVVLAVAVALVLLDRFFGFSSAWARFIATELAIQTALDQFQIRWQQGLVDLPEGDIPPGNIHDMLELARKFVAEVDGLVETETSAWISEFQESLKQIEDLSQRNQRT